MPLLLRDLIDERELGLRLVSGDAAALRRQVVGAHVIEIPHPSQWLDRNWVLLTTGLRLRGDAAAQRALVQEAAERRLAAIGFGVEVVFRSVPAALLAEARRIGFPLFTIAAETPFREIVSFVDQALGSDMFRVLKRRLDIETSLVDSMASDNPEEALVRRLGGLVDAAAAVYRPDGRVLQSVGAAPLEAIWRELCRDPSLQELTVGRWSVLVEPVLSGDESAGVLAVATRQHDGPDEILRSAARSAARLLGVMDLAREAMRLGERTVRAELLDLLLDPSRGVEVPDERLAAMGFDVDRDLRVAIVDVSARSEVGRARATEMGRAVTMLEIAAETSGCPAVVARRRGRITLVVQERERDLEGWTARLAAAGFHVLAGVGRPFRGGGQGALASLRDAELALEHLRRSPGERRHATLRFEEFGLAEWLLASTDPRALEDKASAWLEPLRDQAELYRTLLVYLDTDMDVQEAAAQLHLHENSLRYRLRRIEKLLGASLRELQTLTDLYLATAAERSSRRQLTVAG
jgi:purine catabolism regulator